MFFLPPRDTQTRGNLKWILLSYDPPTERSRCSIRTNHMLNCLSEALGEGGGRGTTSSNKKPKQTDSLLRVAQNGINKIN